MLHHRKNPEKVIKSYAYAAVAKAEGVELLYFSPRTVDFTTKTINGFIMVNGRWQKTTSPFPDVIFNTGSPVKLSRSSEIVNKLRETIPFTTNSIGNKMRVYERLKKNGGFSQYLIPSEIIHSTRQFFTFLDNYRNIIFKPVNGRKGKDIIFIRRTGDKFNLLSDTTEFQYDWDELRDYITTRIRQKAFLVQPYIKCRTKSGNAYDFRLHVQKDGEGKWVITAVYPRISAEGRISANINNGGSTNYLIPFLKQEFGDDYYDIKRYLEHFSLCLAEHLDQIQNDYFSETIDELGIDVALDDLGKIWIIEVNWRPGCPPAFYLEMDVVRNMIRYAIFLVKERLAGEGENVDL
jgi:UDP-N-acetylmuramoyl-tripeptide--D-alanyl-D-alanine ligase